MRDIYNVRIVLELLALDTAINHFSARDLEDIRRVFVDAYNDYKKDKSSLPAEDMYHLDNMFHNLFIEHTSNHYIRKLMPSISERIQLGQLQAYIMTDTFETSTLQHLEIIDALEAKDLPEAKRLLQAHLEWSYKVMFEAMIKSGKKKV